MEINYSFEDKKFALMRKVRELDNTKDKQFSKFFDTLVCLGFFTEEDVDDVSFESGCYYLPFGENFDITVGFYMDPDYDTYVVGIDPSSCYDKTSMCSVIVSFGELTDEELKSFYDLFRKLINKGKTREEWFSIASSSFCGEYFKL